MEDAKALTFAATSRYVLLMELPLPLLADINLHVGIAEDACDEGKYATARNNLEKAEESFEELRGYWPDLGISERGLLAAMVKPLRARYESVLAHTPAPVSVSQGEAEADAEEENEPVD